MATTTLPLPNRNEVLIVKQAAVIDHLSGGRLTLGVSLGGRPDDYEVFGATLEHRVTRFRRQIARIRQVWAEARQGDREHGVLGPSTGPGSRPAGLDRGDHRAGSPAGRRAGRRVHLRWCRPTLEVAPAIQSMRPRIIEAGKTDFSFNAVAYIAIGGQAELAEAVAHHERYDPVLPVPAEQAIHLTVRRWVPGKYAARVPERTVTVTYPNPA